MDPERADFVPFVWRDSPAAAASVTVTWTVSQDSCDWTMPATPLNASEEAAAADPEDAR